MSEELIIVNSVIGPTQFIIAFSCAEFGALSWDYSYALWPAGVSSGLQNYSWSCKATKGLHGEQKRSIF